MSLQQPVFSLILAPSGAGKSSYLKKLRAEGHDFHHIDRDSITIELLNQHGIDGRQAPTPQTRQKINTILRDESVPAYLEALNLALSKRQPHIAVDYPISQNTEWLERTLQAVHQAGYKIELTGIYVPPDEGLKRVLSRTTHGMRQDEAEAVARSNDFLAMTLDTYGQFPSKFCALAQRVPEARLYDNSGKDLKLVAAWQAANPYPEVEDIKTYQAFTALGGIDVSPPPCFAILESAGLKDDLAHYTFGIRGKIVPEQKIFARPTRQQKPKL